MTGIRSIHFDSYDQAREHQKEQGGHIFVPNDDTTAFWFPFTMTPSAVFGSKILSGVAGTLNPRMER